MKQTPYILLFLLVVVGSVASGMSISVYENSILGVGAPHPAIDGNALNRLCTGKGAQTTRITSAAAQVMLEDAMYTAGASKAYLGARYEAPDFEEGDWTWMSDDWAYAALIFCEGYVPCTPTMYTNWAPGFPSRANSDTSNYKFLLHETENGGWCNREGLAFTSYFVACTFDDLSFSTFVNEELTTGRPVGEGAATGSNQGGDPSKEDEKESFPTWAIAVIVVGIVVLLALIVIPAVVCICCKKDEEPPTQSRSNNESRQATEDDESSTEEESDSDRSFASPRHNKSDSDDERMPTGQVVRTSSKKGM